MRPTEAAKKIGVALSTLWGKAKHDAEFPRPVKISANITIFFEDEIDAYLEACAVRSREGTALASKVIRKGRAATTTDVSGGGEGKTAEQAAA